MLSLKQGTFQGGSRTRAGFPLEILLPAEERGERREGIGSLEQSVLEGRRQAEH